MLCEERGRHQGGVLQAKGYQRLSESHKGRSKTLDRLSLTSTEGQTAITWSLDLEAPELRS